mmetsp:Transcript_9534/g.18516  ORF Transcript_9534/g.18516 Transcript_9534/m.18516 type:complete len:147 (-) Transcript_9534:5980-6420(-)
MASRVDLNSLDFESSLDFSQFHAEIPDFEGRTSFISELEKSIDNSISNDELNQAIIDESGLQLESNLEGLEGYHDSFGVSLMDLMRTQKVIIPKVTAAEIRGNSSSTQLSPANAPVPLKIERQEVNSNGWSCTSCVNTAEENCCLL